eukprot:gene6366-4591_t
MYLPPQQREKPKNPFKFERSRNFVIGATGFFVVSVAAAALLALRRVQERQRETVRTLQARHAGNPRVVIIGAGPAGSALAASLTRSSPQTLVTVVEREKTQVFQGQVPHAHVGHRSYDVNTSGGLDFLRSPATWNVTREAQLVRGTVLEVRPQEKVLVVQEPLDSGGGASRKITGSTRTRSAPAAPRGPAEPRASDSGEGAARQPLPVSWFGWLAPSSGVNPSSSPSAPPRIAAEERTHDTRTGHRLIPYDVLVIASGAQRTLGAMDEAALPVLTLKGPVAAPRGEEGRHTSPAMRHLLSSTAVDCGSIALQPGTTRDLLAHLFKGEVLHVKVPPVSFAAVMNAVQRQRRHCAAPTTVDEEEEAKKKGSPSSRPASSSFPNDTLWAFQQLTYPTRQDDATFVSTTNLMWKFLCYFNKLRSCPLYTISSDATPIPASGGGPASASISAWNAELLNFWRGRQRWGAAQAALPLCDFVAQDGALARLYSGLKRWGERSASWVGKGAGQWREATVEPSQDAVGTPFVFHPLHYTYPQAIDPVQRQVLLRNFHTGASWWQAYRVLVLDLPLRAGPFIEASGLHRQRYVEEAVLPLLRRWRASAPTDGFSVALLDALAGFSVPQLRRIFAAEASFVDVDPETLQHRRYPDVFALGDAAGLPTIKSYAAAFAQVPVVSHNVQRVLDAQERERRYKREQQLKELEAKQRQKKVGVRGWLGSVISPVHRFFWPRSSGSAAAPSCSYREGLARYSGYSSFHVVMTPWRCMWPAVTYATPEENNDDDDKEAGSSTYRRARQPGVDPCSSARGRQGGVDPVRPLEAFGSSSFLSFASSNASWRGVQGMLNGFFCQSAMYELLYFFVFMRGLWYPPRWFVMPTFTPEDGLEDGARKRKNTDRTTSSWWSDFL